MREHIAWMENAGIKNAGATSLESDQKKFSKAPDKIWLSWRSCLVLAKCNSQASRPVNVATNRRQCVRCQQSYPRSGHQTRHETR